MKDRNQRAVFLDRDGTIIRDADYLTQLDEIEILPGVPEALRRLKRAGYLLLVVTNQSAVARGWLTEHNLRRIHRELQSRLAERDAEVDGFYYCPHLPDGAVERYSGECECRKPKPGMLLEAAADRDVDLSRSWMIGDSERDVEAGRRAGCRTILLAGTNSGQADATAGHLLEAVDIILRRDAAG